MRQRACHILIITSLLLSFLLMSRTSNAAKVSLNPSPALRTVLQQAQQTYLTAMGADLQQVMNTEPDIFASILGIVMQRQKNYLHQNPDYIPKFEALKDEAISLLHKLALANNNRHPTDGHELSGTALEYIFYRDMRGESNSWFIQNLRIDPARVGLPFMLNQVVMAKEPPSGGDPATPGLGAFHVKKGHNSIRLLDQDAEPNDTRPQASQSPASWQVCPDSKESGTPWAYVDTNNNPNDRTFIECSYPPSLIVQTPLVDGVKHGIMLVFSAKEGEPKYLASRTPYVNGEKSGMEEHYLLSDSGQRWLFSQTPHVNGKRQGMAQQWDLSESGGRYLEWLTPYVNDKIHGIREFYSVSKSGRRYLFGRDSWVNGQKHGEDLYFEEDGRMKSRTIYKNGQKIGN